MSAAVRRGALLAGALLLAGCGSSTGATTPPPITTTSASPPAASSPPATSSPTPTARPAVTELKTATTALGQVVTDGAGTTLYMFTKDTQGTTSSACTGACLAAWPLVVAETPPRLTGVSAPVALIPTADGRRQVTLGGWPLYYYAKDAKPGDVTGQNVGGVWFVLRGDGVPVKG